jgi:hypothetical protein
MSDKFIPNGDFDFATRAGCFARTLMQDPARFGIAKEDCDALADAVQKFRAALEACRSGSRSEPATRAKKDAREHAVQIMRRLGTLVRSNPRLDAATKMTLGIRPRDQKPKMLTVPNEPPRLRFWRAHHETAMCPQHELVFTSVDFKPRPEGAVRLELFVDLVPPDEEIPAYPGANHAGRPWYLRSYTKSPIKLTPPMARVPMRVVYWARWADTQGNVGPFSATAAGWIEGGSHALLPGGTGLQLNQLNGPKPVRILEDASTSGPAGREEKFHVALLEVRYGTINASEIAAALPSPVQPEVRRLEAPPKSEAA